MCCAWLLFKDGGIIVKRIRQLSTFFKIERWAIDADVVLILPTGSRGWRTDWADFLAQGHLEPGFAASENKNPPNLSV